MKSVVARYKFEGIDFEECVQEGYLAVIQATEKFESNRNSEFSTYVYPWIRSYVARHCKRNFSIISYPQEQQDIAMKSRSLRESSLSSDEEIAKILGIRVKILPEAENMYLAEINIDSKA